MISDSAVPAEVQLVIVVVGSVLAVLAFGGAFAYMFNRHRAFATGLRGTAVVIGVQRTSLVQRHSVVEKPTDRVILATQARPRGVSVNQKLPAGQYVVGQIVPVVQRRGRPDTLFVDRPDLERPVVVVYAPLAMIAVVPVLLYAALTGQA